uniref:Uncharacterized protein n=1 Tax=Pithovirus LCPAC401 TaxID=2506595 RepID=A0A481ZDL1_9VIRU|nr:MAG: hypothetical protein LCPAC401_03990 [Pithovirus LCPAC401]
MSEENLNKFITPKQQDILERFESGNKKINKLSYSYGKLQAKIWKTETFEKEFNKLSEDHDKLPSWKIELSEILIDKNAANTERDKLNNLIDWSALCSLEEANRDYSKTYYGVQNIGV